jgi:hypothetical protein
MTKQELEEEKKSNMWKKVERGAGRWREGKKGEEKEGRGEE